MELILISQPVHILWKKLPSKEIAPQAQLLAPEYIITLGTVYLEQRLTFNSFIESIQNFNSIDYILISQTHLWAPGISWNNKSMHIPCHNTGNISNNWKHRYNFASNFINIACSNKRETFIYLINWFRKINDSFLGYFKHFVNKKGAELNPKGSTVKYNIYYSNKNLKTAEILVLCQNDDIQILNQIKIYNSFKHITVLNI